MSELKERLSRMSPEQRIFALERLPVLLALGEKFEPLHRVLTDFSFLQAKVRELGARALLDDYESVLGASFGMLEGMASHDREDLAVLRYAIRGSAHVLAEDPEELASQLWGRVFRDRTPRLEKLLRDAIHSGRRHWLRPMSPSLAFASEALIRTLNGHSDAVRAVAVTPDGQRVISGSKDRTLKLWDLTSGDELRTFQGHLDEVTAVAVTRDGKYVISGSRDRTIKIWDLESGDEIRTLEGDSGCVEGVAPTADGCCVISVGLDETLKLWDLQSGKAIHTLDTSFGDWALAVPPNGRWAIAASSDRTVKVWDLALGKQLQPLKGHRTAVLSVAVTTDGRYGVSGSADGTIKLWDLSSAKPLATLKGTDEGDRTGSKGHLSAVWGLAVAPNASRIVSASDDRTVKVWTLEWYDEQDVLPRLSWSDLRYAGHYRTLKGHAARVSAVAVTPNGRCAISASDDHTLKVWDLALWKHESRKGNGAPEAHRGEVTCLAVTADGRYGVSGSSDRTLRVWDLESAKLRHILLGHHREVVAVKVTPDGGRALSRSADNAIKVWDLESGEELRTLKNGGALRLFGFAARADDACVVSACLVSDGSGGINIWNLETGQMLDQPSGFHWSEAIAITARGRRLVTNLGSRVVVWDLESGDEIRVLKGDPEPLQTMAVAADGRHLVSTSYDGTIKVWNLETGAKPKVLRSHSSHVTQVALAPREPRLVAVSSDGAMRVLDFEADSVVCTLTGPTSSVDTLVVTPDGSRVVSISKDKTLKIWALESGCFLTSFRDEGALGCVCVSPDCRTIVAAGVTGLVHFLRLEGDRRSSS